MRKATKAAQPRRQPSGIDGLDAVLRGGFFRGGIYIVAGPPGVGKTILGNQACFRHVAGGGRALYVTLLSETHAQMLLYMQSLAFYDGRRVGDEIRYLSGYSVVEQEGLDGLLKLLRRSVREQHCELLVIDGVITAESLAASQIAYKKFIHELQTWVGLIGCTVLLLTSSMTELAGRVLPAHTMVDGILDLRTVAVGPRALRQLQVLKFRGAGYGEGAHTYRIGDAGLTVFPRLETLLAREGRPPIRAERIRSGIEELDRMFGGGYPAASTTLVLGPSGSGKTLLGLHFLDAGTRAGQEGILFGFFEKPDLVREKARRLGLIYAPRRKPVHVIWQPPFEGLLDELGLQLLERVDATGATRVFIDGVVGFEEAAVTPRLAGFFAALTNELAARGVTTLITDEVGAEGMAAIVENIVVLRHVEEQGQLARQISVLKSRETDHERALRPFAITDRGIVLAGESGAPRRPRGPR